MVRAAIDVLQSYVRFRELPHWRRRLMGAERTGAFGPKADRLLWAIEMSKRTFSPSCFSDPERT